MYNRRRHKRVPVRLEISIDRLYNQEEEIRPMPDQALEVSDVSKTGLGFESGQDLPLGYYFNAKLVLDEERYFYCVLRIIRKEQVEDAWLYGCEFVGLAQFLADRLDEGRGIPGNEGGAGRHG
ncbi:PilZ domain-containing protein [Anaerotalea alkaliphila]|uniref:PilZ domain-containing protein n=1 Tax=Anaerotalea alkaliphila TaxID=2662126 RepID=A0A7X5HV57_9FIRM|nr:PilZ domain-containing protein [Anaerotalea alkaliphila]NDL67222.1 PilZ domain-containing protein [Anaerotalea alkaliphila]